ncbi:hypothetical protein GLOIN_2v1591384 [Rhizophagus clarus]|uniref:Uncharacterized protein n=1 Tax=Rhizophagus clarus TaxID=94130 RepID=A0A8H3R1W1_9GLOM|nr:hypothetical protein GLOIN_2v1591384 [Rhizophagus clarus]
MATKRDDNVEVNKKSIEKLLRTNSQIISKLEVLITGQKNLKTRLSGIEKKLNDDNKNNNTIDPEYIKEFVKKRKYNEVEDNQQLTKVGK